MSVSFPATRSPTIPNRRWQCCPTADRPTSPRPVFDSTTPRPGRPFLLRPTQSASARRRYPWVPAARPPRHPAPQKKSSASCTSSTCSPGRGWRNGGCGGTRVDDCARRVVGRQYHPRMMSGGTSGNDDAPKRRQPPCNHPPSRKSQPHSSQEKSPIAGLESFFVRITETCVVFPFPTCLLTLSSPQVPKNFALAPEDSRWTICSNRFSIGSLREQRSRRAAIRNLFRAHVDTLGHTSLKRIR